MPLGDLDEPRRKIDQVLEVNDFRRKLQQRELEALLDAPVVRQRQRQIARGLAAAHAEYFNARCGSLPKGVHILVVPVGTAAQNGDVIAALGQFTRQRFCATLNARECVRWIPMTNEEDPHTAQKKNTTTRDPARRPHGRIACLNK